MTTVTDIKDVFRNDEITALFQQDHAMIRYQGVDIVTFDDAEIILSSGGIDNKAVKSRINQAGEFHGLNYHVFQRSGKWYVETPEGPTLEFKDGIKFKRVKNPIQTEKPQNKMTKSHASKIILQAFKTFPDVDINGQNAKQRLYDMELREVRKIRAGKKRPNNFNDSMAAKFLAVKHTYDILRGAAKYTLEDALDMPQSVLYSQALVSAQAVDFAAMKVVCDTANFKAITYEMMSK